VSRSLRLPGRPVAVSLAAALSVLSLACSSTPPPSIADGPPTDLGEITDAREAGDVTITMADNVYQPRAVRVAPGATVTFRNDGANVHDATPVVDGSLVAVTVSPTESATMTVPTAPGTYRFYCTLHASPDSGLQRGAFVVG
jgi:plastocyanin